MHGPGYLMYLHPIWSGHHAGQQRVQVLLKNVFIAVFNISKMGANFFNVKKTKQMIFDPTNITGWMHISH